MLLLIDHYDSFVHNQARYLGQLGLETIVIRHDRLDVDTVRELAPRGIILSPGPCTPQETGTTPEIIRAFLGTVPLLGVCLGHQTLAAATGGKVAPVAPVHGRVSQVQHDGQAEFIGVPQDFPAARYHSLAVTADDLPAEWEVSATTPDGIVMAIRHRQYRAIGWQFHPESILTRGGYRLLHNFLVWANIARPSRLPPDPFPVEERDAVWSDVVSKSGLPLNF